MIVGDVNKNHPSHVHLQTRASLLPLSSSCFPEELSSHEVVLGPADPGIMRQPGKPGPGPIKVFSASLNYTLRFELAVSSDATILSQLNSNVNVFIGSGR